VLFLGYGISIDIRQECSFISPELKSDKKFDIYYREYNNVIHLLEVVVKLVLDTQ